MAEQAKEKSVTEVKAYARGIHMSPRKVRLVTDLLKAMPVAAALAQLRFMQKRAALPVAKLINSAVANAAHNFQIEMDRLFVKRFFVDGGPVFKRFKPRAQGRAFPVEKRTSHLNLVLGVLPPTGKTKKRPLPAAQAVKAASAETEVAKEPKDETAQKQTEEKPRSRFSFWPSKKNYGRKGAGSTGAGTQGKHYTGFDRRGGE